MLMTEVVEESLKVDARFRHLTVMPIEREEECECCSGLGYIDETLGGYAFSNPKAQCSDCDGNGYWIRRAYA
ncbi:hypothetical protein CUB19_gp77 [Stenotrophomonas phage CUB19]|nr:hypothetical protein CUB19_gp77 [Stenotrophomonas phage CUB19]